MTLSDRLEEELGIHEVTPEALDGFTGRDLTKERLLLDLVLESDPTEIDNAGLLVWVDNRTQHSNEHEALVEALKSHFGEDYERYRATRKIVFASDARRSLDSVKLVLDFLVDNKVEIKDSEKFTILLGPYESIEQTMKKLNAHNKLTRNRLTEFYQNAKVPIFQTDCYSVTCEVGYYGYGGGFSLSLNDQKGKLVYVSGWLHNNTHIASIHGAKPSEEGSTEVTERIDMFRRATSIHPANLGILIYLKLGEILGHPDVRINGNPTSIHNRQRKNSHFYDIPRNYFRLRVNHENGYYEFDATKRDTLLAKFAGKSDTVTAAFKKIDDYMT